jgi:hypothetical protein
MPSCTTRTARRALLSAGAALLVGGSSTALAQQPPQQPPQTPPQQPTQRPAPAQPATPGDQQGARSPEAILQRFTRAIDPQGQLASLQGIRTVSEWKEANATAPTRMTVAHAKPSSVLIAVEGPNGSMKQGFNGSAGWSSEGGTVRTLSAAETEQLRAAEGLQSMGRSMSMFSRVEPGGERQVDGQPADCLRLTWKSGVTTTECYARATGLLVESRGTTATAQGNVETVTKYANYQAEGGIMVARTLTTQAGGQTQQIKVTEVAVGPVDPKLFAPPARASRP